MDCIAPEIEDLVAGDLAAGDGPEPMIIQDIPSGSYFPEDEEVDMPFPVETPPPLRPATPDYKDNDSNSFITWTSDHPLWCKPNPKTHRNKKNAVGFTKEVPLKVRLSRSNSCLPVSGPPSLSLSLLRPLVSCGRCGALPIRTAAVHSCWAGHQVCAHCYGDGHTKCEICKDFFECRNEELEGVLQRLRLVCPGLFPGDDLAPQGSQEQEEHPQRAVQHSSHRPLDCPHLTCYRVVAANGFLAHFEFEHPTVPVFQMTPGYFIHFSLPARLLQQSLPRVIAVIEVNVVCGKGYGVTEKKPLMPSFPVRRDVVLCALLSATVTVDAAPDTGAAPTHYLAAWCSSLSEDAVPLTYVLHTGRLTYHGSMTSLHVTQDPVAILRAGQCLALAPPSRTAGAAPLDLKFMATATKQ